MDYYSNLIDEAGSDNKSLFRTIDRLLHRKPEKCLPSCSSATELANNFITFFENKIINIRCKLEAAEMPDLFCTLDKLTLDCQLNAFSPTSIVELSEVARTVVSKSCSLDPSPAVLLKENFDMLLPTLCRIVNLSLESGYVPPSLKTAVLLPLLKKPSLDHEILSNYRPISNLKVISKIIEKLLQYVFRTTWNPTNLMNRYNQPTSDFIAVKPLLYVYTMIFCVPLTIATVLYSCCLIYLLLLTLLITTFF